MLKSAKIGYYVQRDDNPSKIYTMNCDNDNFIHRSCMQNKNALFFKIYDDIPSCSIAFITDDNGYLIGRALLWDNVTVEGNEAKYFNNPIKIMDTCYYRDKKILAALLNYGKENGYWLKKSPTSVDFLTFKNPENEEYLELPMLSVDSGSLFYEKQYMFVPCIDTFNCVERGKSKLTTWITNQNNSVCLNNQEGEAGFLTGSYYHYCASCNRGIDMFAEYLFLNDEPYCIDCCKKHFAMCDCCGRVTLKSLTITVFSPDVRKTTWCEVCFRAVREPIVAVDSPEQNEFFGLECLR